MLWKTLCCAAAITTAGTATSASGGDFTYLHDDGVSNGSIAPFFGDGFVALNAFTVSNGFDTITSIDVAWALNDGDETVTAAVWSDPNQDGNPSDGVLLGTSAATLAATGLGFQNIALTNPIDVGSAGDIFFVGVYFDTDPEYIAVRADGDYDGPNVAWFAEYLGGAPADPTDLSGAIADQGFAYLIRANAIPAPGAVALLGFGGLLAARRRR